MEVMQVTSALAHSSDDFVRFLVFDSNFSLIWPCYFTDLELLLQNTSALMGIEPRIQVEEEGDDRKRKRSELDRFGDDVETVDTEVLKIAKYDEGEVPMR